MTAISLFSSGGIGDLALESNGIAILLNNELLHDRCCLLRQNFPNSVNIEGDINENIDNIVNKTNELLNGSELDILFATPPCQGMSKNGRGTLLNNIKKGLRPELDERNQLIINAVKIAKQLNPRMIVFENVPEMENTVICTPQNDFLTIINYLHNELGNKYVGKCEVVEFADYGVPQRRQRLITVFTKDNYIKDFFQKTDTFLPKRTHSFDEKNKTKKWVTLRNVIEKLPPLDAKNSETATSEISYHKVAVLDETKYFWISNTPEEQGAMDNQCCKCGYQDNKTHGSKKINGINQANKDTPIRCEKCGELLPRPCVVENGEYRIMKGFTSAYRRMKWDLPANTLTMNLSYACSDSTLHPVQNRVLSLYEAMLIHTIGDYNYQWKCSDNVKVTDKLIREVIGESIPPRGLEIIFKHLCKLLNHEQVEHLTQAKTQTLF
ncbi:MAG: DNA cytosine methyltransferase [Paludibacter sp.]|nr:DNA cytosine methyltransferase [Paludibacter sp.]